MLFKQKQRKRRHNRVRAKIAGTSTRPRFYVFRSNKYVYGQLIDDEKSITIFSATKPKAIKSAGKLGAEIAEGARAKKIENVVFDRGGHKYHGKIKAIAEAAREGGLKF